MATLERIIKDIRTLNAHELRAVQDTIDAVLRERAAKDDEPLMSEDEFEAYLAAKGIIAPVKTPNADYDFHRYPPIKVSGKPLSETIIEERR